MFHRSFLSLISQKKGYVALKHRSQGAGIAHLLSQQELERFLTALHLLSRRLLKEADLLKLRCKPPRTGAGAGVLSIFLLIRLALEVLARLASDRF
jgi:hypothetical protein